MKIRSGKDKFFPTDGRTDRHFEAKSRLPQFCQGAKNPMTICRTQHNPLFFTHKQQLQVSACKPSHHQAVQNFIRKHIVQQSK